MKIQLLAQGVILVIFANWFAFDAIGQSDLTPLFPSMPVLKNKASCYAGNGDFADARQPETNFWVVRFDGDRFALGLADLNLPSSEIWENDVGEGFKPGTRTLALEFGANGGVAMFGGHQRHDLALASLSYGYVLGPVLGKDHWYRGNWELRLELFGGSEFSPTHSWIVGLTPHVRYDFATGTRWVPFVDVGAGVTGTGISAPDLGSSFEFNLQSGGGVHYFIRRDLALTIEAHYLHVSCAGITSPNLGLNGVTGMIGLTKFF